jgi:uncharacterized repeat protein (TIGR01451 family)
MAALTLTLSASATNPAPGTNLIYSETFANTGSAAALNNVITLPVPSSTCFVLGSASTPSLPPGLTAAISYYNSSGAAIALISGACGSAAIGYDANVSDVRWTFTGSLAPAAVGTLQFTVHVP